MPISRSCTIDNSVRPRWTTGQSVLGSRARRRLCSSPRQWLRQSGEDRLLAALSVRRTLAEADESSPTAHRSRQRLQPIEWVQALVGDSQEPDRRGALDESVWLPLDAGGGSATTTASVRAVLLTPVASGSSDALLPHSVGCIPAVLGFFFLRVGLSSHHHQDGVSQER